MRSRIAWPTVLQNAIGGLQGIIDHAMVGHYVGFTGNAAIGVSWQIFLVVIVFISSLFTGMAVPAGACLSLVYTAAPPCLRLAAAQQTLGDEVTLLGAERRLQTI